MITSDSVGTVVSGGDVSSLTFPHTVGVGDNSLLCVGFYSQTTVTGITFNGKAMTYGIVAGAFPVAGLVYQVAPDVGTHNVVISMGSQSWPNGLAHSWFGVNQTVPVGTGNGTSGTGTASSVEVLSEVGDIVIDNSVVRQYPPPTITQNSPQILLRKGGTYYPLGASYIAGASPSVTIGWSGWASNPYAYVGIALKPATSVTTIPVAMGACGCVGASISASSIAVGYCG